MIDEKMILNGRYELIERIGSGGMAIVYKAKDNALGRIVAIKMMQESLTNDEGFRHRFQREAHSAANLTHPNIVTVHDIGEDGNHHYIVMEYIDGLTLKQIIRQYNSDGRCLPINRVIDLAIQMCSGIGYAHRAQLVHCDLKPQNVLVTRDDRVKIADFGIARAMSQITSQDDDSRVWGTPQYFAPEQAAGEKPTPATDVYALGVVLFEMLTGRLPFDANTPTGMALKHLQEQPPLPSQFNPDVPLQLDRIVDKVLSKEPSGRYRTAGQLGRILAAYRQQSLGDTAPAETTTAEQPTQIYQRPVVTPISPVTANAAPLTAALRQPAQEDDQPTPPRPQRAVTPNLEPTTTAPKYIPVPVETAATDWTAVALGLLAILALLGLIPLWYAVWQAWLG